MRILIGWLFFLLAIMGELFADTAYERTLHLKQSFRFDPYPDKHGETVNAILQTIAEGSGKLRVFTKYTFSMNVEIEAKRFNENRYLLTLTAGLRSVEGDILYRDFSLEKVLIPDKADFKIAVHCSKGKQVFYETLRSVDVPSENDIFFESVFHYDNLKDPFEVIFSDVFFYYDARMHERFTEWTMALESYYAAGDKLLEIQEMINGLHAGNPENLLLDEFRLCDAEVAMAEIQYAPFHDWVDIHQNDPEHIFPVLNDLNNNLDSLRTAFNHAIAHIDSLYYEYAVKLAQDTCLSAVSEFFMSAVSYNPFHIPSHLALMQIEMQAADKKAAIERLGNIYALMYPGGFIKIETDSLSDYLLEVFYDTAWELILERRYLESLAVLDNVRQFCKQTQGNPPCPPFVDILTRQNHLGMYDSFIVVSSRALRDDNLELASTYIGSAIDYQVHHKEFIPDKNKAMGVLFMILTRYRVLYELSLMFQNQNDIYRYHTGGVTLLEENPELIDFLKINATTEDLKTAVLNYAVLSSYLKGIELLEVIRSRGVHATQTAYQQFTAGKHAAIHYRKINHDMLPGEIFGKLNVHAPWYRQFRQGFLDNW